MPDQTPTFSVVVPTYNRLPLLQKTLEGLFRQTHERFEVIVVNDGSSDGTSDYLARLAAEHRILSFEQKNLGPARARNLGLQNAGGNFVAFIDDDCIAPPDWLERYAARFIEGVAAGYGGKSSTGNTENLFALTNDFIANFFKAAMNVNAATGAQFLTSNNAAYRRAALEKVGGFDPRFRIGAEERDLNFRLVQAGESLGYDPEIVVEHCNDAGFWKFLRHQFDQGKGSYFLYHGSTAASEKINQSGIPAGMYIHLFAAPFKEFGLFRGAAVSFLIFLAQIFTLIGYFRQALSRTPPAIPRMDGNPA